jgi:hypothetical protein
MTDPRSNAALRQLLNGISTDVQFLPSQTLAAGGLYRRVEAGMSAAGLLASVFVTVAGAAVLVSALVLILVAVGLPASAPSSLVGVTLTGVGAIAARLFRRIDTQR